MITKGIKKMNQNSRYKKQMGLLLDKVDGKYYAITDFMAFELNEVGARILDLCNGENDLSAIAKKLAYHYGQDIETVSNHVSTYIEMLLSNNLIKA